MKQFLNLRILVQEEHTMAADCLQNDLEPTDSFWNLRTFGSRIIGDFKLLLFYEAKEVWVRSTLSECPAELVFSFVWLVKGDFWNPSFFWVTLLTNHVQINICVPADPCANKPVHYMERQFTPDCTKCILVFVRSQLLEPGIPQTCSKCFLTDFWDLSPSIKKTCHYNLSVQTFYCYCNQLLQT